MYDISYEYLYSNTNTDTDIYIYILVFLYVIIFVMYLDKKGPNSASCDTFVHASQESVFFACTTFGAGKAGMSVLPEKQAGCLWLEGFRKLVIHSHQRRMLLTMTLNLMTCMKPLELAEKHPCVVFLSPFVRQDSKPSRGPQACKERLLT